MGKRGPKPKVNKKNSNHYVDNDEFLALLIEYKNSNCSSPRVYEKLGAIILKIAQHVMMAPNFVNYDKMRQGDMISNATYYMLAYCVPHKRGEAWVGFDTDKYTNPFAYFSETTKRAYWQHINQEKERDERYSSLSYIDSLEDSEADGE
jgi:hypothetical protein